MKIGGIDVDSMSQQEKLWVACAIAGMAIADEKVTEPEVKFLKETVSLLGNSSQVKGLKEKIQKREKPKLHALEMDRKQSFRILRHLARMAASDRKLSYTETEFLMHAGEKLGYPESFIHELIEWANQQVEADLVLVQLSRKAQEL